MIFLCAPVYVVGLSLLLTFGAGIGFTGIGFLPLKYVPFERGSAPLARLDDHALDRARHAAGGGLRAHDEQLDARGAARGVRAHGARQGTLRTGA